MPEISKQGVSDLARRGLHGAAHALNRGASKLSSGPEDSDQVAPTVHGLSHRATNMASAPELDFMVRHLVEHQLRHLADNLDTPMRLSRALQDRTRRLLLSRANTLPAVTEWSGLSSQGRAIYGMPENKGRLVRILDFVQSGDRIVDIGSGSGSVGIRLVKSGLLDTYCGIELSANAIESFHGMAAENAVDRSEYEIQEGSAYDLAEPVIGRIAPSLITILEVLEHVPDPEGLVAQVAQAMSGDADLLVSVPVLGQIEHDWGHLSVFDSGRIQRMASNAGLNLHWIEPVMGQWVLALMSKSGAPRARVRDLPVLEDDSTAPDPERFFFRTIDVTDPGRFGVSTFVADRDTVEPRRGERSITVETDNWAGFTVYMPGVDAIRIHVQTNSEITNGKAAFRAKDGSTIEQWELSDTEIERVGAGKTLVFRRGHDGGRYHRNVLPGEVPERFELAVQATGTASITAERCAYVPLIEGPWQLRARNFGFIGVPSRSVST